jgi:hypothetical protein
MQSQTRRRVRRRWSSAMVAMGFAMVSGGLMATSALGEGLPDHRGYELVSPVEKNGGQPTLGEGSFRASATGGALVFDSNVPGKDAQGTGLLGSVSFRSDRTAAGWSTQSVLPAQDENPFALFSGAGLNWLTPDLSHGLLAARDPGLVAGAPQRTSNLYLTDGYGRSPVLLSPSVSPPIPGTSYYPNAVDASTDLTRVAFDSIQDLTSDAPAQPPICMLLGFGCRMRVYQWDHGTLQLASVLPDGTPAPNAGAGPPGVRGRVDEDKALSDDGSRLYFSAPLSGGTPLLYLRKDESQTVWVSESEASAPASTPSDATFLGASADGTRAFFSTDEQLLDADQNGSSDLYMYTDSGDPSSDSNLTLISAGNDPPATSEPLVEGVLGVSDDGQRVYFAAANQLVSGESTAPGDKIFLWDHGTVRYITTVVDIGAAGQNWAPTAAERTSQITNDGRYLLFTTAGPQPGGFDNAGHQELDRFDAETGEIVCVSCGSDAGPATADASFIFPGAAVTRSYFTYSSRALSADGRRVFFNTAEALVPEDTNGRVDTYEWEDGAVHLISSGQSENDSYFVDASASGDDAYFVTRERLVGWDVDTLLDVYDARVGGGFPEPPVPHSCAGDACEDPSAQPPGVDAPGSTAMAGSRSRTPATFSVAALSHRQLSRWAKTGNVTLRVHVSGPGSVAVRVRRSDARGGSVIASASQVARQAATVRLHLHLSDASRARLIRTGLLRVTLNVRYSRVQAVKQVRVSLVAASSSRIDGSGR